MNRKIFITVGIMAVILSCCKEKVSLQKILPNHCYWDIWDKGSPHPINSCFKFTKEGDCDFYYYNFYAKKRQNTVFLFNDNDVIVPNKWSVLDDSIKIRSNKYYVIRYTSDSVFLTATAKDTMVLVKNCTTYNSKEK